ncbi:hypothetical protein HDU67_002088, partial [Dinochytrium kinnereticum]
MDLPPTPINTSPAVQSVECACPQQYPPPTPEHMRQLRFIIRGILDVLAAKPGRCSPPKYSGCSQQLQITVEGILEVMALHGMHVEHLRASFSEGLGGDGGRKRKSCGADGEFRGDGFPHKRPFDDEHAGFVSDIFSTDCGEGEPFLASLGKVETEERETDNEHGLFSNFLEGLLGLEPNPSDYHEPVQGIALNQVKPQEATARLPSEDSELDVPYSVKLPVGLDSGLEDGEIRLVPVSVDAYVNPVLEIQNDLLDVDVSNGNDTGEKIELEEGEITTGKCESSGVSSVGSAGSLHARKRFPRFSLVGCEVYSELIRRVLPNYGDLSHDARTKMKMGVKAWMYKRMGKKNVGRFYLTHTEWKENCRVAHSSTGIGLETNDFDGGDGHRRRYVPEELVDEF